MNELRRMAYLDALGIDSYVSRAQLPGAAPTRRLAIVRSSAKTAPDMRDNVAQDTIASGALPVSPSQRKGFQRPDFGLDVRSPKAALVPQETPSAAAEPVPRFTLSAIIAGDWLWLEDLNGLPLATEQVQLVQSMALALGRDSGRDNAQSGTAAPTAKPDVAQFDWPMHTNRQLDLGEEAARASVAAFINRRLEQRGCLGLVLLGQAGAKRVSLPDMEVPTVITASSAEMIANPALKQQAWRDLQPLLRKP
jgi:hypothetical protein